MANFTQYFILTPEKHRSPHVWLFKGSRLAVAATIDTMHPALGDLTSVPLNDIITAGSNIVQTLQRVMAAADKIFKALPPPFPVRNGLAWANDTTLLDTRVLWEVSYETDSASFAYNAHAGSAGWTTREWRTEAAGFGSQFAWLIALHMHVTCSIGFGFELEV